MAESKKKVDREVFGRLPDGTEIEAVRLRGDNGFEVRVIGYGAALQSIFAPDRAGRLADVVLGCEDLAGYVAVRRFLGATVGRYANRIANGTFELDGERFQLPTNDGANALHGGLAGFDRKAWTITATGETPSPFVTMSYVSADGEEGYPGQLKTDITYRISGGTEVSMEIAAATNKPTIVNLTNHAFFNLAGEGSGDVLDHELTIDADHYTPIDEDLIPTGAIASVDGTPFDFRESMRIGERIDEPCDQLRLAGGYDHNYVLRRNGDEQLRRAALLAHRGSATSVEIWTSEPGLQLYTGNRFDGTLRGAGGAAYGSHAGVALETQHFPDSPSNPQFPATDLSPGETYSSITELIFSGHPHGVGR